MADEARDEDRAGRLRDVRRDWVDGFNCDAESIGSDVKLERVVNGETGGRGRSNDTEGVLLVPSE